MMHGFRGQPSPKKIDGRIQERAIQLVREEYIDFGPTLASEYLAREHAIAVSRETLRQWMIAAGIWKRRKQRIQEEVVAFVPIQDISSIKRLKSLLNRRRWSETKLFADALGVDFGSSAISDRL